MQISIQLGYPSTGVSQAAESPTSANESKIGHQYHIRVKAELVLCTPQINMRWHKTASNPCN